MKFWTFRPSLGIFCGKTFRARDLKFGELEDSIPPYNIYFLREKLSTKFFTINFWKWTKIEIFKVSQGAPLTSHAHQIWHTPRTRDVDPEVQKLGHAHFRFVPQRSPNIVKIFDFSTFSGGKSTRVTSHGTHTRSMGVPSATNWIFLKNIV